MKYQISVQPANAKNFKYWKIDSSENFVGGKYNFEITNYIIYLINFLWDSGKPSCQALSTLTIFCSIKINSLDLLPVFTNYFLKNCNWKPQTHETIFLWFIIIVKCDIINFKIWYIWTLSNHFCVVSCLSSQIPDDSSVIANFLKNSFKEKICFFIIKSRQTMSYCPKIQENNQFRIIELVLSEIPTTWGLTYFLKKRKIFGSIVGSFIAFGGFFSHFQITFELGIHSFDDQFTFRKSEAPAHFQNKKL